MSKTPVRLVGLEQRERPRFAVHWLVRLFRDSRPTPIEGLTRDISSQGFSCCVHEPILIGEVLRCEIEIPSPDYDFRNEDHPVLVETRSRVIRVEDCKFRKGFGIACLIEDYHVVPRRDGRLFPEAAEGFVAGD